MNGALAIVVFLSRARWTSNSPTESRQCRPGFFHNVTLDLCQVCPSGMYTDSYNLNSRCNQCSRCTGLHMVVTECNASSDTVCRCPDGYYEHDDGCSPKTVAHVEERPHDKPEWTWTQSLLIVTFVLVIILAISLVLHCSGVTKKLPSCPLKCTKDQSARGTQQKEPPNQMTLCNLASKDQVLERLNEAPGQLISSTNSESRQILPPNGTAVYAASDRANNTTPQLGSEASAAAVGTTIASSSTPLIDIAERGAEVAGPHGETAQSTAQISVQVHSESKLVISPQKEHKRSQRGDAADLQKAVELPFKANPIGPANPDKLEAADASSGLCQSDHPAGCTKCCETHDPFTVTGTVPPQQCVLGLGHPDGCVRCNETSDLLTSDTVRSAEEVQHSITSDLSTVEHASENLPLINEDDSR